MAKLKFEVNDHALVEKIKQGDTAALRYLYREYYPMIQKFILRNSGNEEQAQDIYQEGMIALYERLSRGDFDLSSTLKTYIYSICRNKWLYQLRLKNRDLKNINDFELFIEISQEPPSPAQEPPEYEAMMQQVIDTLDDKCRELLRHFYFARLSMSEIAEKMGYNNDNTAKSKKNKCMDKAREKAKALLRNHYNLKADF